MSSYTYSLTRDRWGRPIRALFANFDGDARRLWHFRFNGRHLLRTPKEILTELGYEVAEASEEPWDKPISLGENAELRYLEGWAPMPDAALEGYVGEDDKAYVRRLAIGPSQYRKGEYLELLTASRSGVARAWIVLSQDEFRVFTIVGGVDGKQLYEYSEQAYSSNPQDDTDAAIEWWLSMTV